MGCSGCGHAKLAHRLQANGNIQFIRKGPEPPADMQGYVRDKGDEWLFKPISAGFPQCYKAIAFHGKNSAGMNVLGRLCTHLEKKGGSNVTPTQCNSCPLRRNVESSE